jgi:cyanate permease
MLSIAESFRFKMLYFFMFGAYGVLMPYFPLFFDTLGINKAQIGILSMLPNFCSFLVAPLFSVLGILITMDPLFILLMFLYVSYFVGRR